MNKNRFFYYLFILFVLFLISCNNIGRYEQNYFNYAQYKDINWRNKCWFPDSLLKEDASSIKNVSFLRTKCVFGVFIYCNEKSYMPIFTNEAFLDSITYELFVSQLERAEKNIPKWFLDINYWKSKYRELVLIDNCYAFKDSENKQIYYFHPQEDELHKEEKYPGIRNTIR